MLVSPGISNLVKQDDILKINIETGEAQNLSSKKDLDVQSLSDYVLDILRRGGIKPLVKRQLREQQN